MKPPVLAVATVAMFACASPRDSDKTPVAATPTDPSMTSAVTMPEHLTLIVDAWQEESAIHHRAAMEAGRAEVTGEWRWTDEERVALEDLRERARASIRAASPDDAPWLFVGYATVFFWFGLGTEWADALVELPIEHPVWGSKRRSLLDWAREASDPAKVEAFIHAVAAVHDNPYIDAESLFLQLRDADRVGDWELASRLQSKLDAIQVGPPEARVPVASALNSDIEGHHPDRMLRTATRVPHFCAPLLTRTGTEPGCLDEMFPHEGRTLIVGTSSWCGPCREVMPEVVRIARDRSLRVILIGYDQDEAKSRAYRAEYDVDDWPAFVPIFDASDSRVPGDLALRSIPFMALVDGNGVVEMGPPWLDVEALASMP